MLVTCALNFLFVAIYATRFSANRVSFVSRDIFGGSLNSEQVRKYLQISIPSIVMLCAEWWGYEFLVLLATLISVGAIGAMTISYNCYQLILMFPYGFQIGGTACVGNTIGEGNAKKAKFTAALTAFYSILLTMGIASLLAWNSREVALAYTDNLDTVPVL